MGIAAGGNINPQGASMFEPIGGSAPKYTGQGVINPMAAICAGQMMLDFLGETAAAVENVLFALDNLHGYSCVQERLADGSLQLRDLDKPEFKVGDNVLLTNAGDIVPD